MQTRGRKCPLGGGAHGETEERPVLGPGVCGRLILGGIHILGDSAPMASLGMLGFSHPSLGRKRPWLGGSGGGGVGRAGWGAPTVRLADRCHFLFGFRASGRGVSQPLPPPRLRED